MKKFQITIFFAILAACTACNKNKYFPSDITSVEVNIERFDKAFLSLDDSTLLADSVRFREGVCQLYQQYPSFTAEFAENIVEIPSEDTTALCEALYNFFTDTIYGFREMNKKAREVFADVSKIQEELNTAFSRIHYLYPDWYIPSIYLFESGFVTTMFNTMDQDIAVSIDMYLGSDWPYYNQVAHEYEKITMRKECIAADVVVRYMYMNVPNTCAQNRLIDQMLYTGKLMYVVAQLLPKEQPWEVMGYTKEQWQWCEQNEKAIWTLMMDKKDLYKTDPLVLTSYIRNGPFTSEISQQSPGRLGIWIGWKIIESYMKKHPDMRLQELLETNDSQRILEDSYYKP